MREYILKRDGAGPLIFEGELIAEASFHPDLVRQERCQTPFGHAHHLRIYRTPDGRFILEIIYECTWKKRNGTCDPSHFYATVHDSPAEIAPELQKHRGRIDEIVLGPPPGMKHWQTRRKALLRQLTSEYDAQVSELLDHEIFAEQL